MISAAQRLALPAVGGSIDSLAKWKEPKAREMLKNAVRTHRPLHALLRYLICNRLIDALIDYSHIWVFSAIHMNPDICMLK
jgi:hypothetical protein